MNIQLPLFTLDFHIVNLNPAAGSRKRLLRLFWRDYNGKALNFISEEVCKSRKQAVDRAFAIVMKFREGGK